MQKCERKNNINVSPRRTACMLSLTSCVRHVGVEKKDLSLLQAGQPKTDKN